MTLFVPIGIPPEAQRPKCRRCGKPLKLNTYSIELDSDEPPTIGSNVVWSQFYKQTMIVRGVTRRKRSAMGTKWFYTCWDGRYGYGANGLFCTPTCGWRWACNRLQGK